jgi:hypothetical protein
MSDSEAILLPRRPLVLVAKLFGALALAGMVTLLIAPLMGLPAIGWAWASMTDWDGINTRETLLFLMPLLPILAPMPIAFAGFWRVLFASAPPAVVMAERPPPVKQVVDSLHSLRIREDNLRNTRALLQGQLDVVAVQLDTVRAQREVEAELLAAS